MMSRITIITPVFNGQQFIGQCIQTVISQQYPGGEHLIIDGGSTDATLDIIRQYAAKYPHIRWISEKDNGQSDAMNKGIRAAAGEIISFLNVDDYYEPGVLERVGEIFERLPEPSLVVGNCNVWNSDGKLLYVNKPADLRLEDLLSGKPFPVNPSAYFYHKSLHQVIGMYDEGENYALDLDFLLRAVQAAHTVYIDQTWGNYRFIRGTKTYEDMKNGTSYERVRNLLIMYRKDLDSSCLFRVRVRFALFDIRRRTGNLVKKVFNR